MQESLSSIVLVLSAMGISSIALAESESMYKCKLANGDAVYSQEPCSVKSSKKVTVKHNTLDHKEMRSSKLYKPGESAQASGDGTPAVTSMKKIEGAGFQEFPASNTGSSYTNFR